MACCMYNGQPLNKTSNLNSSDFGFEMLDSLVFEIFDITIRRQFFQSRVSGMCW
jgi:hypothetical protein